LKIREVVTLSDYIFVSVMSDAEHQPLDSASLHIPELEVDDALFATAKKPIVLYCKTGRTSRIIGAKLLEGSPELKLLSLAGGLKAFQKFKALS